MPPRALIAVAALGVAVVSAIAFMRVFAGIVATMDRGGSASGDVKPAAWHLLHTPTRLLLAQYRAASPGGKLGGYLQAIYAVFGAAVIAFFASVMGFFQR